MVKIQPDFHFEVDNQFTIKDEIVLSPDSVEVTGPDLILDTLGFVFTERSELGLLSRNFSDKIKLRRLTDLEYDRSKVECLIELAPATTP